MARVSCSPPVSPHGRPLCRPPTAGGVRTSRMHHGKQRNPTSLLPGALMAAPVYLGRRAPLPPCGAIFGKTRRSSPPGFMPPHLVRTSFESTGNRLAIRSLLRAGPTTGSRCCTKSMTSLYGSSKATTPLPRISPRLVQHATTLVPPGKQLRQHATGVARAVAAGACGRFGRLDCHGRKLEGRPFSDLAGGAL